MVNSPYNLCVNFRIGSKENLIENYKQLQELESGVSKTIFALKDFTTCEEALTNRKAMHYNFTLCSLSLSSFMIRK